MNKIIIIGAGALGQELAWLVEEINDFRPTWDLLGFLDDFAFEKSDSILGYPVLGKIGNLERFPDTSFVLAFGDPRVREKQYHNLSGDQFNWASLVSPTVRVHKTNVLGKGVIIGRYSDLTVNCRIDDFVFINIHVVLGHEVEVGSFSVISPNVTVHGGAKIGRSCQIGANSYIKDVKIGDFSTVGASSCVVKPVEENCVVVGVPAKVLHTGTPNVSISRSER